MKFPYLVVHNHIEYPPFTEVPVGEKVEEPKETIVETKVEETKVEKPKYSKTEINRMSLADLRKVAKDNDIDGADTKSGAELKKDLINALGL